MQENEKPPGELKTQTFTVVQLFHVGEFTLSIKSVDFMFMEF